MSYYSHLLFYSWQLNKVTFKKFSCERHTPLSPDNFKKVLDKDCFHMNLIFRQQTPEKAGVENHGKF